MLIETFAILQVICFILFWVSYKVVTKFPFDTIFWAITILFAGTLAFQSLDIEQHAVVVDSSTLVGDTISYQYNDYVVHKSEYALLALNIGVGSLALLFFFLDLYQGIKFRGNAKQ